MKTNSINPVQALIALHQQSPIRPTWSPMPKKQQKHLQSANNRGCWQTVNPQVLLFNKVR